jgi:GrpB-like predicted nucleotidyltransferase (UPF0157 family)
MVNPNDDPIELVPSRYDVWQRRFADERDRITASLANHALDECVNRIEHVGSTAIRDLPAKDIVDIDIVAMDDAVADVSRALEAERGGTRLENTESWHPIFRTHDGQRFNDHVFAASDDKWKVSVVTREVLCKHSELRREYEQLKRELACDTDDLTAYSQGKTEFIERVLEVGREDHSSFNFAVPAGPEEEQA